MKLSSLTLAVLVGASAFAAQNKPQMTSAFQELSRDDQVEFVRAVNKSMESYEASSNEKRLVTIYALNREAVRASQEKERKAVIAEVFATAPFDALPTISDRFAKELFNRKAAGFSDKDDSFMEFMTATLTRIRNRLHSDTRYENKNGARMVFAVICFLKASEGQPEDLKETLKFFVPSGSQEIAYKSWIPSAMGENDKPPTYQPMLDAGVFGEEPKHNNQHPLAVSEWHNLLVGSDLRTFNTETKDVRGPTPFDNFRGGEHEHHNQNLGRVPIREVNTYFGISL